jgi:hypothetical protein
VTEHESASQRQHTPPPVAPWSTSQIRSALRSDDLDARFLTELHCASQDARPRVIAKWEDIARKFEAAYRRAGELLAQQTPGGSWDSHVQLALTNDACGVLVKDHVKMTATVVGIITLH